MSSHHQNQYKSKFTLEERIHQSETILAKYPFYVPVIAECHKNVGIIKKQKFLVPQDVNCSNIIIAIRNQLKLDSSKSLFMFYNDNIVCPTDMVKQVYQKALKEQNNGDKFFYVYVTSENTFG